MASFGFSLLLNTLCVALPLYCNDQRPVKHSCSFFLQFINKLILGLRGVNYCIFWNSFETWLTLLTWRLSLSQDQNILVKCLFFQTEYALDIALMVLFAKIAFLKTWKPFMIKCHVGLWEVRCLLGSEKNKQGEIACEHQIMFIHPMAFYRSFLNFFACANISRKTYKPAIKLTIF